MKTPVAAESSEFPVQAFLTLFNLSQLIEIPLFPGFSRKLFKNVSTASQSTCPPAANVTLPPILQSEISTLHSSNPYCTAVFCAVPRNRIFSHLSQIELISGFGASL